MGQRRFERLAEAYLTRHPSQSFTLRNLGRHLVEFLQAEPRWTAPRQKPALDMARLEWAHIEAFDNETRPPLEVDSLLGADPANIYLQLQPHVTLLHLGYELDGLLIEIKREERLRNDASNAVDQHPAARRQKLLKLHLRPRPLWLAVHRQNETVFYKRILSGEFQLLSAFQKGASLAAACEEMAQSPDADFSLIQSWFKSWAALGWFCKLDKQS